MEKNKREIILEDYRNYLEHKELSLKTVNKYLRDIENFYNYLGYKEPDFSDVVNYKQYLKSKCKNSTVNSYLISLNNYWKWLGRDDLKLSLIKCQRRYFYSKEFTVQDYRKMLDTAKQHKKFKWYLVMRCLGAMGIRVGELKFITYESLAEKSVEISFKSKVRTLLIPQNLADELLYYCKCEDISSGVIFLNKKKTAPLDNSVVWRNIKKIAVLSGLDEELVYPHNFRHMFARVYMDTYHNIVELADILGHSSIETTRLYTQSSKNSQRNRIERLNL